MALNNNPIYSGVGQIESTSTYGFTYITASNTTLDATSINTYVSFSSSISGSFVQRIRFKASGTTSATTARVFINNGGGTGSATNNALFDEITLPLTSTSNTAATSLYELPLNVALPPSYRLIVTLAVAQGPSGGWNATTIGGSYNSPL